MSLLQSYFKEELKIPALRSKIDTSTSRQHFEISPLNGEKRLGGRTAAAPGEVLRTDKTVSFIGNLRRKQRQQSMVCRRNEESFHLLRV